MSSGRSIDSPGCRDRTVLVRRQLTKLRLHTRILMIREQVHEPFIGVEAARGSSLQLCASARDCLRCGGSLV